MNTEFSGTIGEIGPVVFQQSLLHQIRDSSITIVSN